MTGPRPYVAFLRAVNVPGRTVRMAPLREVLDAAGWGPTSTYIQSGNIRLWHADADPVAVAGQLRAVLSEHFGFDIPAVVRTPEELTAVARLARQAVPPAGEAVPPGGGAVAGELRRYVAFLSQQPDPARVAALAGLTEPGQWCQVVGPDAVLLLTVPFHRTKLTAARLDRVLQVTSTARDLKVVEALSQQWGSGPGPGDAARS